MSFRTRRRCGNPYYNALVFYTTCGPATTFDPRITGVAGVWYFDDGTTISAASGEEISKVFAANGLHRAVFRGDLKKIIGIAINTDLLVGDITNQLLKCSNLYSISTFRNTSASLRLASIMSLPITHATVASCHCSGYLSDVRVGVMHFDINYTNEIFGSLSSLPSSLQTIRVHVCQNISPGDVSHITGLRELLCYSMPWTTVQVDAQIDSIWASRANYTYSAPSLQIGGTNGAPTGNVVSPVEGSDWHLDGDIWIPLTAGAKIWDLAKDVNSEGFKKWTITYTGGSISP